MNDIKDVPFDDVETGLLDGLKAEFEELADAPGEPVDFHVGTELPPPGAPVGKRLVDRGIFALVEILGGTDTGLSDYPIVSIEVFGRSRAETYALAEAIRVWLLAAPLVAGGVAIDKAATRTRPRKLPELADGVRRWGATYELSVRRR